MKRIELESLPIELASPAINTHKKKRILALIRGKTTALFMPIRFFDTIPAGDGREAYIIEQKGKPILLFIPEVELCFGKGSEDFYAWCNPGNVLNLN